MSEPSHEIKEAPRGGGPSNRLTLTVDQPEGNEFSAQKNSISRGISRVFTMPQQLRYAYRFPEVLR